MAKHNRFLFPDILPSQDPNYNSWSIDQIIRMHIIITKLLPHSGPTWNSILIEFLQVLSCKLGHVVAWLCTCRPPPTQRVT